jgi:hypothetical protein
MDERSVSKKCHRVIGSSGGEKAKNGPVRSWTTLTYKARITTARVDGGSVRAVGDLHHFRDARASDLLESGEAMSRCNNCSGASWWNNL